MLSYAITHNDLSESPETVTEGASGVSVDNSVITSFSFSYCYCRSCCSALQIWYCTLTKMTLPRFGKPLYAANSACNLKSACNFNRSGGSRSCNLFKSCPRRNRRFDIAFSSLPCCTQSSSFSLC